MHSLTSTSLSEPICDTCRCKLGDVTFRKLVLKDKKRNPIIICLHYFSPCWDMDLINEKYSDCEVVFVGFSVNSEKMILNPQNVRNLRNNSDLW